MNGMSIAEIVTPAFAIPGGVEVLVLLLILVLLFGADKIPKLARSSGEAIGEFQKGREEVEDELEEIKEGPEDSTDTGTVAEETTTDSEPVEEAETAEGDGEDVESEEEKSA